jgi:hypothetical protein
MQIVMQQLQHAPRPLLDIVPSLPRAVEQAVLKALAKDPKKRFASVTAFATAFERACRS